LTLFVRNARVVVGDGSAAVPATNVRVVGTTIAAIAPELEPEAGDTVLEAEGRVLMPGFVDAHTHALWAGDRLDEFELKLRGASYLDVLKAGGGIWSTVRSVRAATQAELARSLRGRLASMLELGTTTVEIKSGYGLSTEHELKMLRAIADAAQSFAGTVVPTALLGHALDPQDPDFVRRTIEETLPAVHAEFPGIAVDAYCEKGAWSVDDCRRLLESAARLGHPLRLHVDQFNQLGGSELALELGARSLDHLEATTPESLQRIASSGAFGVMLPAGCFHLGTPYANGRAFVDAGGKLVLATNFNPGSSPTPSIPFVLALAVRKLGLTMSEAVTAATSNAAQLLALPDRGELREGQRADLLLLRHRDERQLVFELGTSPVASVICAGKLLGEPATATARPIG
jgi:imidazolonepropionase